MIDHAPTASGLLTAWERGDGERMGRRALALLAGAVPGASTADLALVPIGRRDAALLDLREQLFGSRFTGITACPSCGEEIELAFDTAEVRREIGGVDRAAVQVDGIDVEFRLPNAGDVAAIESAHAIAAARATLFSRCVHRAVRNGEPLAVGDLPPHVVDAAIARMGELDPQADVTLEIACLSCAHAWREPFDVVAFLWSELAAWARRLLGDVHVIASAYGWSEHEILGLSAARRNAYLEMLQ